MPGQKLKQYDISSLEQNLLTLLLPQEKLYGLEFITAFKDVSKGDRILGFGSLYPTLQRLQRKKLVASSWGDDETGPRRKYYQITSTGRTTLLSIQQYRSALLEWRPSDSHFIQTPSKTNTNNTHRADISALEQDLLSILLNNEKLYGLAFIHAVQEVSLGDRKLGIGSLYPTLQRMQQKKLILSTWGDEHSGPRKKYYQITDLGQHALWSVEIFREHLSRWNNPDQDRVEPRNPSSMKSLEGFMLEHEATSLEIDVEA